MATVKKLPESAVVKDGESPTESEQNTDTAVAEINEETGGEKKEMPEEKENTEENKENYDTEHTPWGREDKRNVRSENNEED